MTKQRAIIDHTRVVGYVRVSTAEQAESGAGLAAQRTAIKAECERRGWSLTEMREDAGVSGKSVSCRPGLASALEALANGEAGTLMVSKLDRLSRSTLDFLELHGRFTEHGWNLVIMDVGVDLSTPNGELQATLLAGMAQWERRIISQRTKDTLAERKAAGVKLGRPSRVDPQVVQAILEARADAHSWNRIANALNEGNVPRAHGGEAWYAMTVRRIALAHGAR